MLKDLFQKVQKELLKEVEAYYAERLVSLVIFGSVGRGTQRFDSDLDFLMICDGLPDGRINRMIDFGVVENSMGPFLEELKHKDLHIELNPIFKTREEALRGSPIFLDMVEDAHILYDREGFFAGVITRLKDRLSDLGAKRIWRGNAWYWDLKPDFKPREVFEI